MERSNMTKEEKWDIRYYHLARMYSTWSKDPRKKVGCVIAKDGYQIGQGYNGFPPGLEDTEERLNDKALKNALMQHAEENALIISKYTGDTAYVYPCMPCSKCMGKLNMAGITRIVTGPIVPSSGWDPGAVIALCDEAGIEVTILEERNEF